MNQTVGLQFQDVSVNNSVIIHKFPLEESHSISTSIASLKLEEQSALHSNKSPGKNKFNDITLAPDQIHLAKTITTDVNSICSETNNKNLACYKKSSTSQVNSTVYGMNSWRHHKMKENEEIHNIHVSPPDIYLNSFIKETRMSKILSRTNRRIKELMNIRKILELYVNYKQEKRILPKPKNVQYSGLQEVFDANKESLYYDCNNIKQNYAFCQLHYILSWDSNSKSFSSFSEQKRISLLSTLLIISRKFKFYN
jgi:hypothetical protein